MRSEREIKNKIEELRKEMEKPGLFKEFDCTPEIIEALEWALGERKRFSWEDEE